MGMRMFARLRDGWARALEALAALALGGAPLRLQPVRIKR